MVWDRQEGRDCYDLIEWLAVQDWCTGKVAMSGTSYLAVSQWFTAAEQPPHLTAINPWEGVSDVYRDLVMRGGMPDLGFAEMLQEKSAGKNQREDLVAEAQRYPPINDAWEDKIPQLDKITVPAYVVSSYSHTLHTQGTFRAWRQIASEEKWLRIHNSLEWPDYYDHTNTEDLRRFFDHYLKDKANGWDETPRVRYAVLDLKGGDCTDLPAGQFPPEGVTDTNYYLDGRTRSLSPEVPAAEAKATYDAATLPGQVSFTVRFTEETMLVGYVKAHLWVETAGTDDADLFLLVQKVTANGTPLQQFNTLNQGAAIQDVTERSGSVLRYKGSPGRLRVSARHLDDTLSTDTVPIHTFDRVEKLPAGEIVDVDVDVDLFPSDSYSVPASNYASPLAPATCRAGSFPATRSTTAKPPGRSPCTSAVRTRRTSNSPSCPEVLMVTRPSSKMLTIDSSADPARTAAGPVADAPKSCLMPSGTAPSSARGDERTSADSQTHALMLTRIHGSRSSANGLGSSFEEAGHDVEVQPPCSFSSRLAPGGPVNRSR